MSNVQQAAAGSFLLITLAVFGTAGRDSPIRQELVRRRSYAELSNQIFPIDNLQPDFRWPSAQKEKQIRFRLHNLVSR